MWCTLNSTLSNGFDTIDLAWHGVPIQILVVAL